MGRPFVVRVGRRYPRNAGSVRRRSDDHDQSRRRQRPGPFRRRRLHPGRRHRQRSEHRRLAGRGVVPRRRGPCGFQPRRVRPFVGRLRRRCRPFAHRRWDLRARRDSRNALPRSLGRNRLVPDRSMAWRPRRLDGRFQRRRPSVALRLRRACRPRPRAESSRCPSPSGTATLG